MLGNAKTFKTGGNTAIIIPKAIVNTLKILPGNRVEFDLTNPRPIVIEEERNNFRKHKTPPISGQIREQVIEEVKDWIKKGESPSSVIMKVSNKTEYTHAQLLSNPKIALAISRKPPTPES